MSLLEKKKEKMDIRNLAIADVLVNHKNELVSYQPDLTMQISDRIRVKDIDGNIKVANIEECEKATLEESNYYWSQKRTQVDNYFIDRTCRCRKPKSYKYSTINRIHLCTCGKEISEWALKQFPIKSRYQFINENS